MKPFRELQVWHKSHDLTLSVYNLTGSFPKHELYALTSQLRRACSSIPTNIAEGCGRNTVPELVRFLEIAMGSASEVEYLLLLSRDLNYLGDQQYSSVNESVIEIKRMLATYIRKTRETL